MKLQAATRLEADAHSAWFDSLSPEQQKQYIELHPHSKFAKDAQSHDDPKKEEHKDSKPAAKGGHAIHETHKDLIKQLPQGDREFFENGGAKPGSAPRRKAAHAVKSKTGAILQALKHNAKEMKGGLLALGKIAARKPLTEHDKAALKATVKDAIIITSTVALGGGLAHGIVGALAHLGNHYLTDIALKSAAHGVVEGSVLANAKDDKLLKALIDQIAELIENGDIPDSAWEQAIKKQVSEQKKENSVASLTAHFSKTMDLKPEEVTAAASAYGNCPECGAPGIMTERRVNGNTTCADGHVHPQSKFIKE